MVRLWTEQFNRGGIDALVPRKSVFRNSNTACFGSAVRAYC
jgi:hypothetical protein